MVTRTLKMQVYFPGLSRAELEGKDGLWYALAQTQGELRRAANRAWEVLYFVRRGALPTPVRPDGRPVSTRTLSYQAMSGAWQPHGPILVSTGRPIGSAPKLGTAGLVHDRLRTDFAAIDRGERTFGGFAVPPLIIPAQKVRLARDGRFSLPIWSGSRGAGTVIVAPHHLRGSGRAILQRIIRGEYRLGDVKLYRDDRKRWCLSVAWTGEVAPARGDLVAGLDLGIVTTATICYVTPDGAVDGHTTRSGEFRPTVDRVHIPRTTVRGWARLANEKSARLRSNRLSAGLREGRGRARKLRVVTGISAKVSNLVQTTVRQTAAAIVATLRRRGAHTLVLEDLTGITEQKIQEFESLEGRQRANARKRFLRWQQGALRAAIRNAAELAGVTVVEVDPAYTSKTCSACGIVWTHTALPGVVTRAPVSGFGRISQSKFRCSCGHEEHADVNAAINIARRGLAGESQRAAA